MTRVRVGLWVHESGTTYRKQGELPAWTALSVAPKHLAAGEWSLQVPWSTAAGRVTTQQLVTYDLQREGSPEVRVMTGVIRSLEPGADESGRVTLSLAGVDVLDLLGGALCWPVPGAGLGGQSVSHYIQSGAAETVLRELVQANWVQRLGQPLLLPASLARGSTVRLRLRFTNLLQVLTSKAAVAGLGLSMGLVDASSTRADLTLAFRVPVDQSARVKLSHKVGSLRTWKQSSVAPTVTRAIVAGGGQGAARVFRQQQAAAAEAAWGWPRELFVDQRGTTDTDELDEAGSEALADGAATQGFDLDAVEAQGIRYGQHFQVGDLVSVELLTGLATTAPLGAVQIEGGSDGVSVKLLPGDPDATNPLFRQAAIIRELRRQVRALQSEEA